MSFLAGTKNDEQLGVETTEWRKETKRTLHVAQNVTHISGSV